MNIGIGIGIGYSYRRGGVLTPLTFADDRTYDVTGLQDAATMPSTWADATYQVYVAVDYADGMGSDFTQLRWFDADGSTPLPYHRESYTDGVEALFAVRVPLASGQTTRTIHLQYSPSRVIEDGSDGEATFEFFDDFASVGTPRFFGQGGKGHAWYRTNGKRAIVRGGVLYVCYLGANYHPYVTSYTIATGAWDGPYQAGTATATLDDHGNPGMEITADGHVHIWYDGHNTNVMNYARTTTPGDISAWTDRTATLGSLQATYPNLLADTGGDIWSFYRAGNGHNSAYGYRKSSDDGATWAAFVNVLDAVATSDSWYVDVFHGGADPDDIHLAWAWHEHKTTGDLAADRWNCYYLWYDASADAWKDAAGTAHTLPITKATMDATAIRVYNSGTERTNAPSVAVGPGGVPHLIFISGNDPTFQWKHATYSAGWVVTNLGAETDEQFDTACLVLDGPALEAYVNTGGTTQSSGDERIDRGGDIVRYISDDAGATWAEDAAVITTADTGLHLYGQTPVEGGGRDHLLVFFDINPNVADAFRDHRRLFLWGESGFVQNAALPVLPDDSKWVFEGMTEDSAPGAMQSGYDAQIWGTRAFGTGHAARCRSYVDEQDNYLLSLRAAFTNAGAIAPSTFITLQTSDAGVLDGNFNNIRFTHHNGAIASTTDVGTAADVRNAHTYEIVRLAAAIAGYQDGVQLAQHTANLPTADLRPGWLTFSTSANSYLFVNWALVRKAMATEPVATPGTTLYLLLIKDTGIEMAEPSNFDGTRQALVSGQAFIRRASYAGGKVYYGRSDAGACKVYRVDPNPAAPNETLVVSTGQIPNSGLGNVPVSARGSQIVYRANNQFRKVGTDGSGDALLQGVNGFFPDVAIGATGTHYYRCATALERRLISDNSLVSQVATATLRLAVRADGKVFAALSGSVRLYEADLSGSALVINATFTAGEQAIAYDDVEDYLYYKTSTGLRRCHSDGTGDEALAGTMTDITHLAVMRL